MKTRILSLLLLLPLVAFGATYYVDYDAGSDAAAGTSEGAAWKHCPGDPNGTGTSGSTYLAAGDTVNFKGGVVYRGHMPIERGGSSGSRIIFQTGSGWGTGNAILSGAEVFSQTWTACTNAGDCWNNSNWSNIWWTTIPTAVSNVWHRLYQDTETLQISQAPNPSDPFNWDRISDEWYLADSIITRTALTDASVLTSSDANYYVGSWCGIWVQGNLASLQPITSFTPVSDTIGFTLSTVNSPYDDAGMARWSVLNHPALIDASGEYAIRTNENRIYLWPKGGVDPNGVTISSAQRKNIFYTGTSEVTDAADYNTFRNLTMCNTYAHPVTDNETESGVAFNITVNPEGNITITNCIFRDFSSPEVGGHVVYLLSSGTNLIGWNAFSNSFNRGIMVNGGSDNLITSNTVNCLNGTTMEVWNCNNTTISHNTISSNTGTHANAITAYDGSDGISIIGNKVTQSVRMLTFQAHANILVANNLFDGSGFGSVHEWNSTMTGYIRFFNNVIINGVPGEPVLYLNSSAATYMVRNNIIDGVTLNSGNGHNLYTDPTQLPSPLGTGEYTNTLAAVIPNYATGNYMISDTTGNGFARDAGTNVSAYGITTDYTGNTRTGTWDIGAYEYVPPTGNSATVGTLTIY